MFTTAVDKLLSQFFALSAEERSCILEVLVDSQSINNSDGVESFLSKRLDVSRSSRSACPHCGSLKVVKNGRHCGTQRFICRDCSKSFGWSSGSFFNHCKKEISQWFKLHGLASSQRVRTKVQNFLGYLFQVAISAARRLTKDAQLCKTDRRRRS